MEISALKPNVNAANLPIEGLAGNSRVSEQQKVDKLSREFEAVMLRQILNDATKKMFQTETDPESSSDGIYKDMVTNALADSISRSGAFGLARSLAKQLQHEFKTDHAADGAGLGMLPVLPRASNATTFSRNLLPLGQAGSTVPLHLKP